MPYLMFTTVLWAFSFSLIGEFLAGQVDSYFSVLTRVVLATAIFLPFIKFSHTTLKQKFALMAIGAVQLGLMYLFYYQSFTLLSVPEVLLFTILTPIYVTLYADLLNKKFHFSYLISAVVAVIGAFIIRAHDISGDYFYGFLVVQGANVCFAIGQVSYAKLNFPATSNERSSFGWFYIGALIVVIPAFLVLGKDRYPIDTIQWATLIWLGVVASGLGYFLWNHGARLVDSGTLAIMNNVLIPLGLIVNLSLWGQNVDLTRWSIGGAVILFALLLHQKLAVKYR